MNLILLFFIFAEFNCKCYNTLNKLTNTKKLIFEDTFENLDNWKILDGQTLSFIESTRYIDNVVVDNDGLHLLTKKNNHPGDSKKYTTGTMYTNDLFGYGYYEARYRYCNATGINNAFWMTSEYSNGALDYELDVNEGNLKDVSTMSMTLIEWTKNYSIRNDLIHSKLTFSEGKLDYNTYGFLYTSEKFEWYFNNKKVLSLPNTFLTKKLRVRFSTAVARFTGTITDAVIGTSMDVKYVRVYSL